MHCSSHLNLASMELQPLSLASIVPASLLLLLAIVVANWFLSKGRKRNYPPIAGNIFHQLKNLHRLVDFQTELSHRYKTFMMLTPYCNYICTVDPANVEYILRTNFANYGKGGFNHDVLKDLLGDGIFAVDGEKWRHQRKISSYEFTAKVLRDYSGQIFRSKATKLTEIVAKASRNNEIIEIQDLLMKSTMDSIFKVGFGTELDTISGSNKEGMAFAKAFDDSSSQLLRRYCDVTWKLKRLLNVGSEASMKKNIKLIDEFVYKIIGLKIEHMSGRHIDEVKKEDILSRFLMEREKDPENISLKYLRDIILNFLIAGRDTTAGTLSWFFYMMCKHPHVQEKTAKEVREATGTMTGDFNASSLTEDALNEMQYLHAVLTETLRLYPAVPLDVKCCFSDDTLPDGFDVRKGDLVIYQPFPMGRMKFLWGEDAEEFRPERWINADGVFEPQSPFKFPAFQAGPRICLGKEFAYRQMKIFAAPLLCLFRFKLSDEKNAVNYRSMVTLQIDGGLHLCATERERKQF